MLRLILTILVIIELTVFSQVANAGDQWMCGGGCQVKRPTDQDLEDLLSDLYTGQLNRVMVRRDGEREVFKITLPDESEFVVTPVGPAFQHQNMQQRRIVHIEDGSFRLRSQAGLTMRLRSALHQDVEAIGELLRLGWDNFFWFDNGIEMDSPQGIRMCFNPDMAVSVGPSRTGTEVSIDSDGHLVIAYQDGIQQRLHACPHDFPQLRDQVRNTVQQQLRLNIDGTFDLEVDGLQLRFRLSAMLRQSEVLDQPGFFMLQNRTYFRYRDGWEQEILQVTAD
ncbi:MAG: hypothetical protein KJN90_01870 [Gammaproteobacteria bacterium]|nr:hypothetical protein [Gammaproteobacteria bacterium]